MVSYLENAGRITLLAEGCRGSLSEVSMWNASFKKKLFEIFFIYDCSLMQKPEHVSENN